MKILLSILFVIFNYSNLIAQEWHKDLDNFLNDELPKFNIPNLEILVVNKDSVLYSKSIGESSPNSTYYIGSVSKSLTAYGILILIAQKKLSFDTKVKDVIPEIQFNNSHELINIWHLLTHTSGIKKKSGFEYLPSLEQLKTKKFKVTNEIINPLRHEYSNLNYSLLGLIIEKISKLSFKEYMYKYVFSPLKMTNSIIGDKEALSLQLIDHYQYFGLFPIKSKQLNFAQTSVPAGFISASSEDLGKYLQLNLSNGRLDTIKLIDPSLLQTMHTVWNQSEYGYAMGWKRGEYNNYKFYQHLGTTANSYSGIFFIPEKELGFVFLSNSNSLDFSENIVEGILNILTDGEPREVSRNEFFLRIGVLLGYLFLMFNFFNKLLKVTQNKLSLKRRKETFNLIICIVLLVSLFFAFPIIAQIPLVSFVKIQPDIGFLILLSLVLPTVLNIIKVYKARKVGS